MSQVPTTARPAQTAATRREATTSITSRAGWIVLSGVVIIQIALAFLWIRMDETPPYWDEAWYLYQGARQLEALQHGIGDWYAVWTQLDPDRPSFAPSLTIPFFALFGVHSDVGLLVNLVALLVLLLAIYVLSAEIGGRRSGLLATLIVGSYPMIIGLSHILLVELTMVALVSLGLLAIWRTAQFRNLSWSILAGVVIGLGLLTKVFYPVFLVGPGAVIVASTFYHGGRWRWPTWLQVRNMTGCAVTALALAAWWYLPNFESVIRRSADAAVGAEASPYGPANPWLPDNLLAYFLNLVGTRIATPLFLLFLVAIVGLVAVRLRGEKSTATPIAWLPLVYLSSSVALSYLVFTSLDNQDPKHISGIVPALAIITGWGLSILTRPGWLPVVLIGLVALSYHLISVIPNGFGPTPISVSIGSHPIYLFYPPQSAVKDLGYAASDPARWPMHAILSYALMAADLQSLPRDQVHLAVIPNHPGIEEHGLRFEAYRREMPLRVEGANALNLWNQDILIHKTGDLGFPSHRLIVDEVLQAIDASGSEFHRLPRTIPLPDGSEVIFYTRHFSPLYEDSPNPGHLAVTDFGDSIRFIGIDENSGIAQTGEWTLPLTYYWKSLGATAKPASVFVHLIDTHTGEIVAQDDHPLFPQVYPTTMWQPDRWLSETRTVTLPASFVGEHLLLRLGIYDENGRLPVTSQPANPDFVNVAVLSRPPIDNME